MLLRVVVVVVCSVKPQCPRQRRCQHPSAASFPRTKGEDEDQRRSVVNCQERRREPAMGDSVQERRGSERSARKDSTMTCGRSIVRPASVSRSETWGESGVRKFESSLLCPVGPFSETQRAVHRRGGDWRGERGAIFSGLQVTKAQRCYR